MSKLEGLTHKLVIKKKVQETVDTVSFYLEVPAGLKNKFTYKPGQFITLNTLVNNEYHPRSYSLSSSPISDEDFVITIKRVKGGVVSNHLIDQTNDGDKINSTTPAGNFFNIKDFESCSHFLFFAAGSGITPIFSILKSLLKMSDRNKCQLFYSSRSDKDIIFLEELEKIQNEYKEQFSVTHFISQPSSDWQGLTGRMDQAKLQPLVKDIPTGYHSYICGPEGFMNSVSSCLSDCGNENSHIHIESFDVATSNKETPAPSSDLDLSDKIIIGDSNLPTEACETIEVTLNGEIKSIKYDGESSILDALLNESLDAPFSCMNGSCMACMGKITSGKAYQDEYYILLDENISEGETLSCQARPASKTVHIDFDDV